MVRGRTVQADCLSVCLGGIAFVVVPMVHGVFLVYVVHVVVAVGLGEDAGGGYAHIAGIALDYGRVGDGGLRMWRGPWHEAVAVYYDMEGDVGELVEGMVHGHDAGAEDVVPVYLVVVHLAYCPCEGVVLDEPAQCVAFFLAELLGVIESLGQLGAFLADIGGEDDCRCEDGACKASTSGFVAACLEGSVSVVGFEHIYVFGIRGSVKGLETVSLVQKPSDGLGECSV